MYPRRGYQSLILDVCSFFLLFTLWSPDSMALEMAEIPLEDHVPTVSKLAVNDVYIAQGPGWTGHYCNSPFEHGGGLSGG